MDNGEIKRAVTVLGLGGAGCRVVSTLSTLPGAENLQLCALDTDRRALDSLSNLPENCKMLCDEQWLLGQGTGGDVMKGQRAVSRESSRLQTLLRNASMLLVVGGLGGGTATGGAGVISRLARTHALTAICLFSLPFAFEGHVRTKTAEDGLREMLALSDTVLGIPNDLLFSVLPAETTFAEAFQMADLELARTVLGVIDILQPGNLLSADMGDLSAMIKSRKNYAAIGVGYGDSEDPGTSCNMALSSMLDSPFLGGEAKLKEADAVMISLTGGEELTLSEVKRTLESAGALPGAVSRVMIGANIRPGMGRKVHLSCIAVKYDDREANAQGTTAAVRTPRRRSSRSSQQKPSQLTLPLTISSCGIFEGRTATIIDGVNFDIPAFVRRQLPVDTGE